jgi:hypothetical protein
LEAQAIAVNDRASFLALQDPDDPGWHAMQEKRFGPLEQVGLSEFGWPAMGMNATFGEAIHATLDVDPAALDPAWQKYLRQLADSSVAAELAPRSPGGELALRRVGDGNVSSI